MRAKDNTAFTVLVVLALFGGILWYTGVFDKAPLSVTGTPGGVTPGAGSCPTTLVTSTTFNAYNPLNLTASENYDITAYLYKVVDGKEVFDQTISDTTAPTAVSLDCGSTYVLKPIATDGASGDNSRIVKNRGTGSITSEGFLRFTPTGASASIGIDIEQQATLQARAFSNFDNGYMYDTSDANALDYDELSGSTHVFTSTTDNTTVYSEGNGFDITFEVRAIQGDTNWNDKGWYILVDLPTSDYDTPTIRVDGNVVSDMKGNLNADEASAWSGYEYVYFVDKPILDGGEGVDIRFTDQLKSGVTSSTTNPIIDIGAKGSYLGVDGVTVKTAGVKDDSSLTLVRTLAKMSIDVS